MIRDNIDFVIRKRSFDKILNQGFNNYRIVFLQTQDIGNYRTAVQLNLRWKFITPID